MFFVCCYLQRPYRVKKRLFPNCYHETQHSNFSGENFVQNRRVEPKVLKYVITGAIGVLTKHEILGEQLFCRSVEDEVEVYFLFTLIEPAGKFSILHL